MSDAATIARALGGRRNQSLSIRGGDDGHLAAPGKDGAS
jgi:hypothetical protein